MMQQKELTAQVDSSFFTRFVDFSTGNAYNENGQIKTAFKNVNTNGIKDITSNYEYDGSGNLIKEANVVQSLTNKTSTETQYIYDYTEKNPTFPEAHFYENFPKYFLNEKDKRQKTADKAAMTIKKQMLQLIQTYFTKRLMRHIV